MDQISCFVTNETLIPLPKELLNNIGNSFHALSKTYFTENSLFPFSNCRKLSNHHYVQLFCTLIASDSKFKRASFYANVNSHKN